MQLTNAPGKLVLPFANSGAKNNIPTASQIGITAGAASLTDGFPPLTRTPIAAGGVPPSGLDMNGILYSLSAALRWANAGGGYVYDGTFATDSNVNGYPKGARVLRSDGLGYWLNTIDGNTVDPESVTVGQAALAGWVPDLTNGVAAIDMTSANVTLQPLQYGKPIISITGTLTANLNLIFPNIAGEWTVVNSCAGNFTITAKTAAGTGVVIPSGGHRAIIWGDGTNIYNAAEAPTVYTLTGNTTLTPGNLGSTHTLYSGSAFTVTLPPLSACPIGSRLELINFNSGIVTVARAGADTIFAGNANVNSIAMGYGDTLTLVSRGDYWFATAGSAQIPYSPFGRSLVPAGAVGYFAMNTAPAGWIKANGAVVNRTTYASLFASIGTTFGAGDGSTTFQLPDLRGQFPRGWDDGRGVDTGRAFGSTQAANTPRDAQYRIDNLSTGLNFANGAMVSGFLPTSATLLAVNSVENRPTNLALLACIKY